MEVPALQPGKAKGSFRPWSRWGRAGPPRRESGPRWQGSGRPRSGPTAPRRSAPSASSPMAQRVLRRHYGRLGRSAACAQTKVLTGSARAHSSKALGRVSQNAKPASDVASARLRARCPPLWAGRPCPEVSGPDTEAWSGSTPTRAAEEGWERTTPLKGGRGFHRGGPPTKVGAAADRRTVSTLQGPAHEGPVSPSSAKPSGAPASSATSEEVTLGAPPLGRGWCRIGPQNAGIGAAGVGWPITDLAATRPVVADHGGSRGRPCPCGRRAFRCTLRRGESAMHRVRSMILLLVFSAREKRSGCARQKWATLRDLT